MLLKLIPISKAYFGIPPISRLLNNHFSFDMLNLKYPPLVITHSLESVHNPSSSNSRNVILCGLKGPRPRYPRVWKTRRRIGTISKSKKLVDCIKGLSNVKEEVYGALDVFIAWELEFPLITVKKALKTLDNEKEWKRLIQVTKWMLSKGQGRTMGSYYTLLKALAEEGRLEEAEDFWTNLFSEYLDSMPRNFFEKMISIYYSRGMHDKIFDVFADMEELGIRPTASIVSKVGDVFQKLGMTGKYKKLNEKYPPPKWEFRYLKGKRVRVRTKRPYDSFEETVDVSDSNKHRLESELSKRVRVRTKQPCGSSEENVDVRDSNEIGLESNDVVAIVDNSEEYEQPNGLPENDRIYSA